MLSDDQFDTMIQDVIAGPAAGPPPHRVLWFAAGMVLWQVNGILLYLLAWLLRHG